MYKLQRIAIIVNYVRELALGICLHCVLISYAVWVPTSSYGAYRSHLYVLFCPLDHSDHPTPPYVETEQLSPLADKLHPLTENIEMSWWYCSQVYPFMR